MKSSNTKQNLYDKYLKLRAYQGENNYKNFKKLF